MHCRFRFNYILIIKCFKLSLLIILVKPPHVVPLNTTFSVVVHIDGSTLFPKSGDYWKSNKTIIVSVGFSIVVGRYPLLLELHQIPQL